MAVKSLARSGLTTFEKYSSLLAGNAAYQLPGAYEWLETVTLGTATASVTFSNLDTNYGSTYQHLQIRMVARSDDAGSTDARDLRIQVNGDTGANYAGHVLRGDGVGVYSNATSSQTAIATSFSMLPRPSNPSEQFGAAIIDVLDFAETTKNKTFRILGGSKPGGEDIAFLGSGLWVNTNALTEIKLFANSGGYNTGSRFSLYGIRSVNP